MKSMLITGGTVFVSRFAAEYFSKQFDVWVLNRNSRHQCSGVHLIECDRHDLGEKIKDAYFDVILDITAYDSQDVHDLLDAVGGFGDYILISSSAVYPETAEQPFKESTPAGANKIWGKYGTDKIGAEEALLSRFPEGYILRPPYLYGPGNNVYREAFVFDCAVEKRPFYLPNEGTMKLQFLHVKDLCRIIGAILAQKPKQHVWNVGNEKAISVADWVSLCYHTVGETPEFRNVGSWIEQRSYFPFYRYEYFLNVDQQKELLPDPISLEKGIMDSWLWYRDNSHLVNKKPLLKYIDENLR